MTQLEAIRDALREAAKDVKLNLQSVLQEGTLSPAQRWASRLPRRSRRATAGCSRPSPPMRIAATIHAAAVAPEAAGGIATA